MSLIKCKECNTEISSQAKQCPKCGSTKHRGFIKKHPIVTTLGVLFLISSISLSSYEPTNSLSESQINETKKVEIINDGKDKKLAIKNVDFKYSWTKGGFGNILLIDMSVKNNNPYFLQDITITCNTFGQSGTLLNSVDKKLFNKIEKGQILNEKQFNMGFINSQSYSSSCEVSNVQTEYFYNVYNR